ncbi:hypothetical protein GobsT_40930 [Gemmata obscuriglobus]|nr:hypothetical protein GobsT_40930 [Gemmata obscuriglobus]VTS08267.1 unnamed protein product [Gemmata obscuriglobus UQM 2246]
MATAKRDGDYEQQSRVRAELRSRVLAPPSPSRSTQLPPVVPFRGIRLGDSSSRASSPSIRPLSPPERQFPRVTPPKKLDLPARTPLIPVPSLKRPERAPSTLPIKPLTLPSPLSPSTPPPSPRVLQPPANLAPSAPPAAPLVLRERASVVQPAFSRPTTPPAPHTSTAKLALDQRGQSESRVSRFEGWGERHRVAVPDTHPARLPRPAVALPHLGSASLASPLHSAPFTVTVTSQPHPEATEPLRFQGRPMGSILTRSQL